MHSTDKGFVDLFVSSFHGKNVTESRGGAVQQTNTSFVGERAHNLSILSGRSAGETTDATESFTRTSARLMIAGIWYYVDCLATTGGEIKTPWSSTV